MSDKHRFLYHGFFLPTILLCNIVSDILCTGYINIEQIMGCLETMTKKISLIVETITIIYIKLQKVWTRDFRNPSKCFKLVNSQNLIGFL